MEFFIERDCWLMDDWVADDGSMCAMSFYATQCLGVKPDDIRRLGRAALPKVMDHHFIDEVIWLNDKLLGEPDDLAKAFAKRGIKLEFID